MSLSDTNLRIAGVIRESIVDGPGIRFTIFAQGCPHKCEGCHNPETHDFNGGYLCSLEKILDEIDKNPLLSGVTFSGGEPFCQPEAFYELALALKGRNLDIIAYSGYTLEALEEMAKTSSAINNLLRGIDFLVDGPFILAERDLTLEFRGSRNQRFISMTARAETAPKK